MVQLSWTPGTRHRRSELLALLTMLDCGDISSSERKIPIFSFFLKNFIISLWPLLFFIRSNNLYFRWFASIFLRLRCLSSSETRLGLLSPLPLTVTFSPPTEKPQTHRFHTDGRKEILFKTFESKTFPFQARKGTWTKQIHIAGTHWIPSNRSNAVEKRFVADHFAGRSTLLAHVGSFTMIQLIPGRQSDDSPHASLPFVRATMSSKPCQTERWLKFENKGNH